MKIRILTDAFDGHNKGDIIEIDDVSGTPVEQFWRRRLRDSVFDNCCEIVRHEKKSEDK